MNIIEIPMNIIDYEILKKIREEYFNLNIKHLTFNDWLSDQFGFYLTGKYVMGNNVIVIINKNKKLLFDIKYQ